MLQVSIVRGSKQYAVQHAIQTLKQKPPSICSPHAQARQLLHSDIKEMKDE